MVPAAQCSLEGRQLAAGVSGGPAQEVALALGSIKLRPEACRERRLGGAAERRHDDGWIAGMRRGCSAVSQPGCGHWAGPALAPGSSFKLSSQGFTCAAPSPRLHVAAAPHLAGLLHCRGKHVEGHLLLCHGRQRISRCILGQQLRAQQVTGVHAAAVRGTECWMHRARGAPTGHGNCDGRLTSVVAASWNWCSSANSLACAAASCGLALPMRTSGMAGDPWLDGFAGICG